MCRLYPGDALADAYRRAGVKTIALDLPGKYGFRQAIVALRRTIREERPSLVVSTLFRSDVAARIAGRLERVPVVSSFVNDTYSPIRTGGMNLRQRAKHRALQALDTATARLAAHFVSNSHAIARSNARALGLSRDDITVIYRARDATRFSENRSERLPKNGRIVILNVARLEKRKGQDDLLEAMPRVLKVYPDATLRIAGEGNFRPHLEKRIDELGLASSVELLGSRDDIPRQLAEAHVFISASEYEGLPGAVIEALLAGVPMALSAMDVHREIQGREAPIPLFPLHHPESIADCILALLSEYASSTREAEIRRRWARKTFSLDTIVAQHEALYQKLMLRPVNAGSLLVRE